MARDPIGLFGAHAVHLDGKNVYVTGVMDCKVRSDAAYTTRYGIPTIDNPETESEYIHYVRKYIKLSSLAESAKRISAVVYSI